jgi:prophage antirepressor-like protein
MIYRIIYNKNNIFFVIITTMTTLIDIYNGILKYSGKDIIIVVDETIISWFYAKQIFDILDYKNSRDILKKFVDISNKTTYESIKQYSKYKYNVQDHAIFINEAGLYELILRSKKPDAIKFKNWIITEVIPSIRKIGKYEVDNHVKKDIQELNDQLDFYKKRVTVLENNQKKEKYPQCGYVYIIKMPNDGDNLYRTGKTDESLNKRLNAYNTAIPDKVIVVGKVKVDSPIAVEMCVKGFLYEYRYRNNRDYFKLDKNEILKVINMCNEMISGDKKILKREPPKIKISENDDDVYGLMAITKEQEEDYYKNQKGGSNKL